MILDDTQRARLAEAAVRRIEAALRERAASGPERIILFLKVSETDSARAAAVTVRRALENLREKVAFSTEVKAGAAPVPSEVPGGHVHAEQYVLDPHPDLILSVSETGGRICVALREPGADPFAPPTSWLWRHCEP